jgi:hypothetical protein
MASENANSCSGDRQTRLCGSERPAHSSVRKAGAILMIGCLTAVSAGCATIGPELITNGRPAYNRAVAQTDNEQMLMVAIQNRYQERSSLLAVTSITANVNFSADARLQAGFGDKDNYEGNLTPFSGGVIYEDNPTITYEPVDGEYYIRQLTSPIPLSGLATLTRAVVDPTAIYMALVTSVNGIYNPDFPISDDDVDERFGRFVAIVAKLTRTHRLDWAEDPKEKGRFYILIEGYAPRYTRDVEELCRLLGLPGPDSDSKRLVIPVALAHDAREAGGLGISTRSVFKLIEIMSASIEVPEGDLAAGIAGAYPHPGPAGVGVRVRYSGQEPDDAYVAVPYRDGWYYIEDADLVTKRFFRIVGSLWGIAIAESASKTAAPILTVPVSR